MSNTFKHKGKGYWNNGLKDKPEVKTYLNFCNRWNRDFGYFKEIKLHIQEKIALKDMRQQIKYRFEDKNIET